MATVRAVLVMLWHGLGERTAAGLDRADRRSGGALHMLRRAWLGYGAAKGSESAAGLAYYVAFSLFPLLVLLLLLAQRLVTPTEATSLVLRLTATVLPPTAARLVADYLSAANAVPGSLGLIALLALVWAASGGFAALVEDVHCAFEPTPRFGLVRFRLAGLAIVFLLGLLLVLALVLSVVMALLPVLNGRLLESLGLVDAFPAWTQVDWLSWVLPVLALAALYRWGPAQRPPLWATFRAALAAGLTWRLALWGFSLYLASGFTGYDRIYGALAGVMVLLFWIYLSMVIVLAGAHLCAAMSPAAKARA